MSDNGCIVLFPNVRYSSLGFSATPRALSLRKAATCWHWNPVNEKNAASTAGCNSRGQRKNAASLSGLPVALVVNPWALPRTKQNTLITCTSTSPHLANGARQHSAPSRTRLSWKGRATLFGNSRRNNFTDQQWRWMRAPTTTGCLLQQFRWKFAHGSASINHQDNCLIATCVTCEIAQLYTCLQFR